MNTRTAPGKVFYGDAAVERFDAIAQALEVTIREVSADLDLEGQRAIRIEHRYGCLGPR